MNPIAPTIGRCYDFNFVNTVFTGTATFMESKSTPSVHYVNYDVGNDFAEIEPSAELIKAIREADEQLKKYDVSTYSIEELKNLA